LNGCLHIVGFDGHFVPDFGAVSLALTIDGINI
jgi:hypothetical protein